MRAELIPLLRCPASGAPLHLEGALQQWIEAGTLVCSESERRYPIE